VSIIVESVSWGAVDRMVSVQSQNYFSIKNFAGRSRNGVGVLIYDGPNNLTADPFTFNGIGSGSQGLFDVATTGGTNVAIGSLFHSGDVFFRRNGIDQIELSSGRVRLPNSSWNGGRLFQYGDMRFWVAADTLLFNNSADPVSSADGRVVSAKTLINQRTGNTTFRVLTHAPVQVFTLSSNATVTMSTDNAQSGDTASIVRPGTEAFTLNVGPGIKTIPSGTAATVDCIFDGSNWVLWRYTEN
jgi:hypothetical protein